MSEAAARLDDPIEHSSALGGLLAGLAIGAGAVLVGIAIVGTGGLGAVALCAMVGAGAATGAGIGQLLGSLSFATHDAGQIKTGSANVFTNGKPAARAHVDTARCDQHGPAPQILAQGSDSVYINGQPAARVGDRTVCDGKISSGSANVFIGGGTETTDAISPEVPGWLERAVLVVGLGSAFVLASPVIVIAGLVGGVVGGLGGNWAGGKLYGEGSDGQKLMAFGGALLGGGLGAKGGKSFDARYEIKTQGLGSNFGNLRIVPRDPKSSFVGKLRGEEFKLPGVKTENFLYVKRSPSELKVLRNEFNSSGRSNFLKGLSDSPDNVKILQKSGFSDVEISKIQSGKLPNKEWEVHHIKPLDDGGTNAPNNLTLIKNEPFHKVITNAQKSLTKGMVSGDSKVVEWPVIDTKIYPPPGV
ncbi:hypothetical protein PS914_02443 [Pseudomonas fluorescens]|uniref:PAAR domain-containing protein n=1 Tax=Pseudomonas fluorescens TaxID=294 RepID=UPI0012412A34|nr:PAAR domain-containing protein [Pseudomonas fluorescens]VVP83520.1 hypothetical protein PS914_02443 [Pseudomonas fluorescens]